MFVILVILSSSPILMTATLSVRLCIMPLIKQEISEEYLQDGQTHNIEKEKALSALLGPVSEREPNIGVALAPKPLSRGPGDWVITGTEIKENENIILTGNMIVESGGNLTLINCTLLINCSYDGEWQIRVEDDGILNVLRGTIITAYNQEHEFLFYVFGQLTMCNSELHHCGYNWTYPGLVIYSHDVLIKKSIISENWHGIWCSSQALICECEIVMNKKDGIRLWNSKATIRNCNCSDNGNHGIFCGNSSPIIYNCTLTTNEEHGSIYCFNSSPLIYKCTIASNCDGITCVNRSSPTIMMCVIEYNRYGICCAHESEPKIYRCNILLNQYGIYAYDNSVLEIHYCNIYGNTLHGAYVRETCVANAKFCWWGDACGPEYKEEGDSNNPEEIWGYILYEPWLTEQAKWPIIYVCPPFGTSGITVIIWGEGFTPNSTLCIYANTTLIAIAETDKEGAFTIITSIIGQPGRYIINATDELGIWSTIVFDLYDYTPLSLSLEVGSTHFRGEIAEFYISTSHHGRLTDVTDLNATLYWPNSTIMTLSWIRLRPGLYKATFDIPMSAPTGTYALLVEARLRTSHIDAWGSAIRSFLLSPTLIGWSPQLTAVEGNVAIIKTDVGEIMMNLTEIKAQIKAIENDIAVLKTGVGDIEAKLETLLEDMDVVLSILGEWTGAIVSVAGYKLLALTTSNLRALWAEETVIKVSLYASTNGCLHIIVPKDLLSYLGTSVKNIDVIVDWSDSSYEAIDLSAFFMLVIRYGAGEHTIEIYLEGAPIYRRLSNIIMICGGVTVALSMIAYAIFRKRALKKISSNPAHNDRGNLLGRSVV